MGFMGESWMKKSSTSTRCRWTIQFSAWGGVFRKRTDRGFSTWSGRWNWGFHAVRYTASSRKAARSRFPADEQLNPAKSWALPAPGNRLRTVWTRSFRSDRSNSPKAVPSWSTNPRRRRRCGPGPGANAFNDGRRGTRGQGSGGWSTHRNTLQQPIRSPGSQENRRQRAPRLREHKGRPRSSGNRHPARVVRCGPPGRRVRLAG